MPSTDDDDGATAGDLEALAAGQLAGVDPALLVLAPERVPVRGDDGPCLVAGVTVGVDGDLDELFLP